MNYRYLFLLAAFLLGAFVPVQAQPPVGRPGTGIAGQELEKDSTLKAENIRPWEIDYSSAETKITTDSLLRWQIWPNFGDFYAYRNDAIAYRQGTIGRQDAFDIAGYSPYEQSLRLEGIDLSNPITGLVNYNYVPHHKIGDIHESKYGGLYSDVRLKRYYIVKPISYLNYDEGKFNYRNLEFMVAQNFTERTNLEISFWDRRDGDNYPRNEVLGNQILFRGYHYLNNKVQIRSFFLRNTFELQESFGYLVNDASTFPFDRYTSIPVAGSNAKSDNTRRDFITGIYHRADSTKPEDAGLEISFSKNKYNMPFSGDTVKWDISGTQSRAFKTFSLHPFSVTISGDWEHYDLKNNRSIAIENWNELGLMGEIEFIPASVIGFTGMVRFRNRSDGFEELELGGGVMVSPGRNLTLRASLSAFSKMPTIQALYWRAVSFNGNEELKDEDGISVFGEVTSKFGPLTLGASARMKQSVNQTFIYPDSTFTSGGDVSLVSGSVFGKFENHRFEIESSASMHSLNSEEPTSFIRAVNNDDFKLWVRSSAFVKGYAFNRATFLKVGLRTLTSPIPYSTRYFDPEVQFWQPNSLQEVHAFFRMDAELSARVRAIMVVLRMENALDGIGQAGYFETSTYPMPGRRLIVGIRAQFRN